MWETLQHSADWDCFITLILPETLKTQSRPDSGHGSEHHPISAKDQWRLHHVGKKEEVLSDIFVGYVLNAGGIWKRCWLLRDDIHFHHNTHNFHLLPHLTLDFHSASQHALYHSKIYCCCQADMYNIGCVAGKSHWWLLARRWWPGTIGAMVWFHAVQNPVHNIERIASKRVHVVRESGSQKIQAT